MVGSPSTYWTLFVVLDVEISADRFASSSPEVIEKIDEDEKGDNRGDAGVG